MLAGPADGLGAGRELVLWRTPFPCVPPPQLRRRRRALSLLPLQRLWFGVKEQEFFLEIVVGFGGEEARKGDEAAAGVPDLLLRRPGGSRFERPPVC